MEELKNIAPKLSGIKKENPFKVPNNYFEDFSARLKPTLESSDIKATKKQNAFIRILKPTLGLAASFALIFMLVYWPLSMFNNKYADNKDISETTTIDNNYYSLIAELDENSLYTLLEENTKEESFSDDELVAYLSTTLNDYDLFFESK